MYERSINEAEVVLSTQKEPLVPVSEVWKEVVRRSEIEGFEVASLSDFTALLEGDRRFQIIPAQKQDQEEAIDGELAETGMGNLGFFAEDRVRLRISRVVDPIVNEDEEEVGSIRRRAFVSHAVPERNLPIKKKQTVSKGTNKKTTAKKSSSKKSSSVKHIKVSKNRKSKKHTRGKR